MEVFIKVYKSVPLHSSVGRIKQESILHCPDKICPLSPPKVRQHPVDLHAVSQVYVFHNTILSINLKIFSALKISVASDHGTLVYAAEMYFLIYRSLVLVKSLTTRNKATPKVCKTTVLIESLQCGKSQWTEGIEYTLFSGTGQAIETVGFIIPAHTGLPKKKKPNEKRNLHGTPNISAEMNPLWQAHNNAPKVKKKRENSHPDINTRTVPSPINCTRTAGHLFCATRFIATLSAYATKADAVDDSLWTEEKEGKNTSKHKRNGKTAHSIGKSTKRTELPHQHR